MKSRTGVAEKHLPDDNKMGNTVTGLEIKSVTAYEVSNNNVVEISGFLRYNGNIKRFGGTELCLIYRSITRSA